jgi:hypothetical protein
MGGTCSTYGGNKKTYISARKAERKKTFLRSMKRLKDDRPTKWVFKKWDQRMWIDFNGNYTQYRFLVDTETNLRITWNFFTN